MYISYIGRRTSGLNFFLFISLLPKTVGIINTTRKFQGLEWFGFPFSLYLVTL